jgi:hypothetical protein
MVLGLKPGIRIDAIQKHASRVLTLLPITLFTASASQHLKVYALDCDNTLWGGAVAEVGAANVVLSKPFLELQHFFVDLYLALVLLLQVAPSCFLGVAEFPELYSTSCSPSTVVFCAWQNALNVVCFPPTPAFRLKSKHASLRESLFSYRCHRIPSLKALERRLALPLLSKLPPGGCAVGLARAWGRDGAGPRQAHCDSFRQLGPKIKSIAVSCDQLVSWGRFIRLGGRLSCRVCSALPSLSAKPP